MNRGTITKLAVLICAVMVIIALSSLLARRSSSERGQADQSTRRPEATISRETGKAAPRHVGLASAPRTATHLRQDRAQTTSAEVASATHSADSTTRTDEIDPLAMMSAQVRANPRDIGLLLDELKKETNPEKIEVLAELIARNSDLDELPVAELLELMKSDNADRRYAALKILGKAGKVTPEMLKAVEEIAKTDPNIAVRERSITTMDEWMQKHGQLSEKLCASPSRDPGCLRQSHDPRLCHAGDVPITLRSARKRHRCARRFTQERERTRQPEHRGSGNGLRRALCGRNGA